MWELEIYCHKQLDVTGYTGTTVLLQNAAGPSFVAARTETSLTGAYQMISQTCIFSRDSYSLRPTQCELSNNLHWECMLKYNIASNLTLREIY